MEKSDYKKLIVEKLKKLELPIEYHKSALEFIEQCNKFQLDNMLQNRETFITAIQWKI